MQAFSCFLTAVAHQLPMGRGGVPGWARKPPPFKQPPKPNTPLPPGYKRQGALEEQECSGGKYTGEWKDNKMHGRGEFKFTREGKERGDRYVGEWQHGQQHGTGTYYYRNLDRYAGEWAHGQKHGELLREMSQQGLAAPSTRANAPWPRTRDHVSRQRGSV
ncbi:MAG: hypothetical protein ACPIOQ_09260 [Promethearchaeia archaeon]